MNINTAGILIVAIFAIIVIAVLLVFQSRSKINLKGPFQTGLEIDASNEPPKQTPGVLVEDAKSSEGGLLAEDFTGRGAEIRKLEVKDDIIVSSNHPKDGSAPKDPPPDK
jgi:hypothetical protein